MELSNKTENREPPTRPASTPAAGPPGPHTRAPWLLSSDAPVCCRAIGPEGRPTELFPDEGQLSGFRNISEVPANHAEEPTPARPSVFPDVRLSLPRASVPSQIWCFPGGDPPPPPGRNVLWQALRLLKGHLNLSGSERKTAGGMTNGTDFRECVSPGRGSPLPWRPALSHGSPASASTVSPWLYLTLALSEETLRGTQRAFCALNTTLILFTRANGFGTSPAGFPKDSLDLGSRLFCALITLKFCSPTRHIYQALTCPSPSASSIFSPGPSLRSAEKGHCRSAGRDLMLSGALCPDPL